MSDYFATDKDGGLIGLIKKKRQQDESHAGEGTWDHYAEDWWKE